MPPTFVTFNNREVCREMPIGLTGQIKRSTMGGNASKNAELKSKKSARRVLAGQRKAREELVVTSEEQEVTPRRRKSLKTSLHSKNKDEEIKRHDADENLVQSGAEDEGDELNTTSAPCSSYQRTKSSLSDDEDLVKKNERFRKKSRKQYYIKNPDGVPTEKYSTDYSYHVRNEDDIDNDDSGDELGYSSMVALSDRWRPEWDHAVQILLNPDYLPKFKTRATDDYMVKKAPFKIPNKLVGTSDIDVSRLPYVSPSTHTSLPCPTVRLYQGDGLDKAWLKRLNKRREESGRVPMESSTFLDVMNTLEIEAYKSIHEILLQPLHSAPGGLDWNNDDEAACDICRAAECEPDDDMVFCDGCNVCVHMSCYGLEELPNDEWLCMKCRLCNGVNPPCVLCPTIGGVLKCTKRKDRWAHVVCALWLPECRFGDIEKREPIMNIEEIADERWQLKCSICDTRQGACIQCTEKSCNTAFHVTCALRSGLEMRIEQFADPEEDGVDMIVRCKKHSTFLTSHEEPAVALDERDNSELRRLETFFYLYVDYEKVSKKMNVPEITVAEIYEYWKQKRQKLDGKPLIKNLQDNIVVDPESVLTLQLPMTPHTLPTTPSRRLFTSIFEFQNSILPRFRNSIDKDRNILTLVVRREKLKKQLLELEAQAIFNVIEMARVPAAVSQRAQEGLVEQMEKLMTPDEVERASLLTFLDEDEASNSSDSRVPSRLNDSFNSTHKPEDEVLKPTARKRKRLTMDTISTSPSSERLTSSTIRPRKKVSPALKRRRTQKDMRPSDNLRKSTRS